MMKNKLTIKTYFDIGFLYYLLYSKSKEHGERIQYCYMLILLHLGLEKAARHQQSNNEYLINSF